MRKSHTFRPFALLGLAAGIALAATGHPWWELFALWLGSTFQVTIGYTRP